MHAASSQMAEGLGRKAAIAVLNVGMTREDISRSPSHGLGSLSAPQEYETQVYSGA